MKRNVQQHRPRSLLSINLRYYLLYRLSHFNVRKINDVDVSMTDTILAEQLFANLGAITIQQFDVSKILGLLPEARRKQVSDNWKVLTSWAAVENITHLQTVSHI